MAGKIQTFVRTVRGLTDDERFSAFEDPHGLLPFAPCKLKAYRENPYLKDLDQPCQLIGVKDGKVIGRRNSFPSRIVADGVVYDTRISGSVYVDPTARSSLYAISLLNQALKFPNGDLNINCMLSVQNQKFYRLYGASLFPLVEFDAGGRWNRYYKSGNPPGWKKWAARVLNAMVSIANYMLDYGRWRGLPDWEVREIDISDEASIKNACNLINADKHRYREEITPEWIKWTLTNDFLSENNRGAMYCVYEGDNIVGFALTRGRAKENTSKIYEWQLSVGYEKREAEFLSLVAKRLCRYGSRIAIWIGEDSEETIAELKKRFPSVGRNYVVVTIADGSRFGNFDGIRDSKNWRLRPGMGDAALWG